jgi:hypothetical protein
VEVAELIALEAAKVIAEEAAELITSIGRTARRTDARRRPK